MNNRLAVWRTVGAALCGCVVVFSAVRAQQAPKPSFKSGVEAVVLDVSVLDKDRRPVRGLGQADFTILEDGKPQSIQTFKAIDMEDVVDVQLAPWTRQVVPDVRRNDVFKDRRLVIIVMDSSTPMLAVEVPRAKQLGRAVVEALEPDDLAAVVYTFGKSYGQNFTQDKAKLLAAVDRFNGGIDKAVAGDLMRAFNQFDATAASLYLSTVSTLRGVAESMAALPERRKALVFVSVGVPLDIEELTKLGIGDGIDGRGVAASVLSEMKETFAAAQRANISVYGADPGGLRAEAANLNQDFLRTVSVNTGGFVITDTNDPAPGITQIYRENGSYYILGYLPSSGRAEGRYRHVEVKVNRPGVTVRARSGYFEPNAKVAAREAAKAATTKQPSPAVKAIEGVVPVADLALRMHAVPFPKEGSREADVAIILQGQHARPEGSTALADDVDVLVHAYDLDAKLQASDNVKAHLAIRKDAAAEMQYGVISRLALKPGRYQLRLGVHSSLVDKSGSVYQELDVPDFSKVPLSLSGVMFQVTPSPPAAPKGKLATLIPIVPTAEREFAPVDDVTAFARIIQGGKDALRPSAVKLTIVDGAGAEVFAKRETIVVERFGAGRTADLTLPVPVGTLKPGPHLLSVVATAGTATTRQDVRFTVR